MINVVKGNIIRTDAEALVNTVNCVGFMGKGIALQFKKAFPDNFTAYQKQCHTNKLKMGTVFIYKTNSIVNPKFIINFPTKNHWRGKSYLDDIKTGLQDLVAQVKLYNIKSIAIPPLGCGLGGLNWKDVRPLIESAFKDFKDVQVVIFEPSGTPDARTMPVGTNRPHLTVPRALFIKMMDNYTLFDYRLTLLEIQKLAYFIQESGEVLRLNYEAGYYGPYAHNLNKVLEIMEGHFIRGYGDSQKPDVEIELLNDAKKKATEFLEDNEEAMHHLDSVTDLIEGFETPYGMELLSSVHWVSKHDAEPAGTVNEAIERVHAWNDRKKNMFSAHHINVAWDKLLESKWI